MAKELFWEELNSDTERLKVIGGWVVYRGNINGKCCCFVPDKKHSWKIR